MDTTNSAQSVPPPENTELAKSDEPPKVDGVEMKEAVPAAAEEGKDAIAAEKGEIIKTFQGPLHNQG